MSYIVKNALEFAQRYLPPGLTDRVKVSFNQTFLPKGRAGITVGHTMVLYSYLSVRRLRAVVFHELKHIEQIERHGLFRFYIRYLIEYIKVGYWDNKYEVEAREFEATTVANWDACYVY